MRENITHEARDSDRLEKFWRKGAPRRPRKQRRSRVADTLVIRNALLLAVRTGKAFQEQHRGWDGRFFSGGGFDFSYSSPGQQGGNYRLELGRLARIRPGQETFKTTGAG